MSTQSLHLKKHLKQKCNESDLNMFMIIRWHRMTEKPGIWLVFFTTIATTTQRVRSSFSPTSTTRTAAWLMATLQGCGLARLEQLHRYNTVQVRGSKVQSNTEVSGVHAGRQIFLWAHHLLFIVRCAGTNKSLSYLILTTCVLKVEINRSTSDGDGSYKH